MNLTDIQQAIRSMNLDGWLFCDFHNRDALAYRILGLDFGKFTSRRWFYYIPARCEPVRLVSVFSDTRPILHPRHRQTVLRKSKNRPQLGRFHH